MDLEPFWAQMLSPLINPLVDAKHWLRPHQFETCVAHVAALHGSFSAQARGMKFCLKQYYTSGNTDLSVKASDDRSKQTYTGSDYTSLLWLSPRGLSCTYRTFSCGQADFVHCKRPEVPYWHQAKLKTRRVFQYSVLAVCSPITQW